MDVDGSEKKGSNLPTSSGLKGFHYLPSMVYLGLNDDHSGTQNHVLKQCSEYSN